MNEQDSAALSEEGQPAAPSEEGRSARVESEDRPRTRQPSLESKLRRENEELREALKRAKESHEDVVYRYDMLIDKSRRAILTSELSKRGMRLRDPVYAQILERELETHVPEFTTQPEEVEIPEALFEEWKNRHGGLFEQNGRVRSGSGAGTTSSMSPIQAARALLDDDLR